MPAAVEMSLAEFAAALERKGVEQTRIDFTQPLKIVRQLIISDTKENFQGSHGPDGQPWLPLRRPRGNSKGKDRPLLDRGILRSSITGSGPGHVEELTRTSLVVGTNLEYAGIHQHGAVIRRGEKRRGRPWVFHTDTGETVFTRRIKAHSVTIPQRQFLGIGAQLAGRIDQVFTDWIARQMLTL